MEARYKELLLPYEQLRLANVLRRALTLTESLDPFYGTDPCWLNGGSEDTETLFEMVGRKTS